MSWQTGRQTCGAGRGGSAEFVFCFELTILRRDGFLRRVDKLDI